MGEIDLLDGQQELFPVKHLAWRGVPRCGDCGRFLKAGLPCMNPRCYGEGAYTHIPAMAIRAAADTLPTGYVDALAAAAAILDAAWPHIIATINPPKG